MSSVSTVSVYERAGARRRRRVPERCIIVGHSLVSSDITGPVWALSGGEGL